MTVDDLCKFPLLVPEVYMENLKETAEIVSKLEVLYGKKLRSVSGYRSVADQKSIYQEINDRRIIQGKDELPIPLKSQHMFGCAVDLHDPDNELKDWLSNHLDVVEELDVYFERFEFTPGWVHLQTRPPSSKKRFFIPYVIKSKD